MAFRFWINGCVVYLNDDTQDIIYEGRLDGFLHRRLNLTSDLFSFNGINQFDVNRSINYTQLLDKDGNLMSLTYPTAQDFSDYLDEQLGKCNAQEGAETTGVQDVNDLNTATNPISLIADTEVFITNDGLGLNSINLLPASVGAIYNSVTNSFDFSNLTIGSLVFLRVDINPTTTFNNTDIFIRLKMGIGAGEYSLVIGKRSFKKIAIYENETFTTFFYIRDDNTRLNPAKIAIEADNLVNLKVNGYAIGVNLK